MYKTVDNFAGMVLAILFCSRNEELASVRRTEMSVSLFGATNPGTSVSCLSSLRSRRDQVLIKDEVVFEPTKDLYKALTEASQRLSDGKSVFFLDEDRESTHGRVKRDGIFSSY